MTTRYRHRCLPRPAHYCGHLIPIIIKNPVRGIKPSIERPAPFTLPDVDVLPAALIPSFRHASRCLLLQSYRPITPSLLYNAMQLSVQLVFAAVLFTTTHARPLSARDASDDDIARLAPDLGFSAGVNPTGACMRSPGLSNVEQGCVNRNRRLRWRSQRSRRSADQGPVQLSSKPGRFPYGARAHGQACARILNARSTCARTCTRATP